MKRRIAKDREQLRDYANGVMWRLAYMINRRAKGAYSAEDINNYIHNVHICECRIDGVLLYRVCGRYFKRQKVSESSELIKFVPFYVEREKIIS